MNKLVILVCAFFLTACSYSTHFVPTSAKVYPPTNAAKVAISPQHNVTLPYKRLGRVASSVNSSGNSALERLREEAARLGANAVINLEVNRSFGRTLASGLAIRIYQK